MRRRRLPSPHRRINPSRDNRHGLRPSIRVAQSREPSPLCRAVKQRLTQSDLVSPVDLSCRSFKFTQRAEPTLCQRHFSATPCMQRRMSLMTPGLSGSGLTRALQVLARRLCGSPTAATETVRQSKGASKAHQRFIDASRSRTKCLTNYEPTKSTSHALGNRCSTRRARISAASGR